MWCICTLWDVIKNGNCMRLCCQVCYRTYFVDSTTLLSACCRHCTESVCEEASIYWKEANCLKGSLLQLQTLLMLQVMILLLIVSLYSNACLNFACCVCNLHEAGKFWKYLWPGDSVVHNTIAPVQRWVSEILGYTITQVYVEVHWNWSVYIVFVLQKTFKPNIPVRRERTKEE